MSVNSWQSSSVSSTPAEPVAFTGPHAPQPRSVNRPDGGLATSIGPDWHGLAIVGVHGGAGERTLARVVSSGYPAGHVWPAARYHRIGVILTCRSHASGLQAAQMALRQWAAGYAPRLIQLHGLVMIADGPGRLPKPLRDLARLVRAAAPRSWEIGWSEDVRLGDLLPSRLASNFLNDIDNLQTQFGTLNLGAAAFHSQDR